MREIKIRDTLSGELKPLEAGSDGKVGIYACGPTTYGPIHIGNARPFVIPMLLRRFIEHEGHEPKLVINVTDVNDKIYTAAAERGMPSDRHAEEMIAAYEADTDALGLGRPDHEPRATETIGPIIDLIEALIERDHAYESGGDVYFRVRSFEPYGQLSNRDTDSMDQGEEAGASELKEAQLDFALWKARKPGEDTFWPSPWGEGRPGWHIECSAMAEELLGLEFAIHGGGSDLVFPHHENELAQTEAGRGEAPGQDLDAQRDDPGGQRREDVEVGGQHLLARGGDRRSAPAAVVRFLISGHYRQPMVFSAKELQQAASANERIREFFRTAGADDDGPEDRCVVEAHRKAFLDALADDFNTPRALAELSTLISERGAAPLRGRPQRRRRDARTARSRVAGGGPRRSAPRPRRCSPSVSEARAAKDFGRADEIRDRLAELGYEVRDEAGGARLVPRS